MAMLPHELNTDEIIEELKNTKDQITELQKRVSALTTELNKRLGGTGFSKYDERD